MTIKENLLKICNNCTAKCTKDTECSIKTVLTELDDIVNLIIDYNEAHLVILQQIIDRIGVDSIKITNNK